VDADTRPDGSVPPFVFDQELAGRFEGVAVAHIGHPLVQRSAATLRSAVWSPVPVVGNVCVAEDRDGVLKDGDTCVVLGFARLVVTGATGSRLHEELIHAAVRYRRGDSNRSAYGQAAQKSIVEAPLLDRPDLHEVVEAHWPRVIQDLEAAIEARREDRVASLAGHLTRRQAAEESGVVVVFATTRKRIESEIAELDSVSDQLDFGDDSIREAKARAEALRKRLEALDGEQERELTAVRARYETPLRWAFPVAALAVVAGGSTGAALAEAFGGVR
jgi:hypothetical protein